MRDEWRNVKSGSALTEMILKCLFLVSRCSTNFSVRGVVSFCVRAGERRQSSALTDREGRERQGGEGGERGRGEARTTNNREEKGGQRRVMGYDALQQTMTRDEEGSVVTLRHQGKCRVAAADGLTIFYSTV